MNHKFKNIILVKFFDKDVIDKYLCNYEDVYKIYMKKNDITCELIGEENQQIKPVFDVDAYDNDINIDDYIIKFNIIFPDKEIAIMKRNPRLHHNNRMKYSYRFYIQKVKISSKNIKKLIEKHNFHLDKNIDLSIYGKNRKLLTPYTTRKYCQQLNKIITVPKFEIIKGTFMDCCASYIEENYEDWDELLKSDVEKLIDKFSVEPKINYDKIDNDDDNDNQEFNNKSIDFIKNIINHLNSDRADKYEDWIKVCFAIIGSCKKSKINKRSCLELIHLFSALNPAKYIENDVDNWFDTNYKKQMELNKNQYGFAYLIHTCLKEDDIDYYDDNYNKTYEKIRNEFGKEVIKINDQPIYIQLNHDRDIHKPECFYIKKSADLTHYYRDNDKFNFTTFEKDKKGNTIKNIFNITHKYSPYWDDSKKTKFERLVFQPFKLDDTLNLKYFNMFRGFRVQHLPINKDYVRIQRILNHIKNVICNKDEYSYNWFLKYLSAILKGRKTNVMIVIRGLEGCGKNIILDAIAYGLIGDDYAVATSCPEKQFFNNFNSLLENRVFTIINEGTSGLRNCMDIIKDLITSDKINIEKKGIDPITLKNYNNFIVDTNNCNIINITLTDRRFILLNCNNEMCGNEEYFTELANDLKDESVLSAFYHYLIDEIDCPDDYDFQKTRPKTNLYKKLQQLNLPNPITYLSNIVNDKILFNYIKYKGEVYAKISRNTLYEYYKEWCNKYKYELYGYTQFENKITEDNKYGISLKIDSYNKNKIFKINKDLFESAMNKINELEDSEIIDDKDAVEFIND